MEKSQEEKKKEVLCSSWAGTPSQAGMEKGPFVRLGG